MNRNGLPSRIILLAAVGFYSVCVLWQILNPAFIALSNNGDFPRVVGHLCMAPARVTPQDFFAYSVPALRHHPAECWDSRVPSSAVVLSLPSLAAAKLSRTSEADVRVQGLFHFTLSILALAPLLMLLQRLRPLPQSLGSAALVWILSDARYTSYWNTFYSDTPALLGVWIFAAGAAWILAGRISRAPVLLATAGAVMLTTGKTAFVPSGVLFAAWLLFVAWRHRSRLCAAGAAMVLVAGLWMILSTKSTYNALPIWNFVFFRLLPTSPNVAADAAELGLRPQETAYVGLHAWLPDSPMANPSYEADFAARVTAATLVRFWLRHPDRAASFAYESLADAAVMSFPPGFGFYPRASSLPPRTQPRAFRAWSDLRDGLARFWPTHPAVLAVVALGIAAWLARHGRPAAGLLLVCACASAASIFFAATMLSATEDTRHLAYYHALYDLVWLGIAAIAAWLWASRPAIPGRPDDGPASQ